MWYQKQNFTLQHILYLGGILTGISLTLIIFIPQLHKNINHCVLQNYTLLRLYPLLRVILLIISIHMPTSASSYSFQLFFERWGET